MPGRQERWAIMADGARAIVLRRQAEGWIEVLRRENPDGRLHAAALGPDRPGRAFESAGVRRSACETGETPPEAARRDFVAAVAAEAAARIGDAPARVAVAAPPRMLGLIRAADLPGRHEIRWIGSDWTALAPDVLAPAPAPAQDAPAA